MDVVKIKKTSDILVIQKKLTLITLKKAVANILGNSRKISILISTVH